MRYFLSKGKAVITTAMCVLGFVACTTVELDFGSEYIPDADKIKVQITTLTGAKAYNINRDSIPTSTTGTAYVGSMVSPLFGGVTMSYATTYLPGIFNSEDSLWGDNPVIDSVYLVFEASSVVGDTMLSSSTIRVTELETALPYNKASDSVYYSNFNIEPYLKSTPLAEFTLSGNETYARIPLPVEFAKQFLDTTGRTYELDSMFIKKFHGLCFSTTPANSRGAIRGVDLFSSSIRVYYNNQNVPNKDTTSVEFLFAYEETNYNQVFTMIDKNYNLSDQIVGIDPSTIGDTINPQEKIYIQAFGGVMGRIDISKESIQNIIDDAKAKGFEKVAINNATISFNIYNPSYLYLDGAFDRLGLMYNTNRQELITDYYPYDENESSQYTPDFGGYLNRASNNYKMNITSFIQSLINGSDNYTLELSPAFGREFEYNSALQTNGAVIDGGDIGNSCQISLTYTLIK